MVGIETGLSTSALCVFAPSKSSFCEGSSRSFANLRIISPASVLRLASSSGTVLNPTVVSLTSARSSTREEVNLETNTEKVEKLDLRRKLFVLNLPWSFKVADIKELFEQCGDVEDVEIIKHKGGKSGGFVFITMGTAGGAVAAVKKFHAQQVSGRVIRVQFARRFKKTSPTRSLPAASKETRFKLYASNLAWEVRSNHLREFFSAEFNPVSSRVVFDAPAARAAGYGFVSFATKEEAQAAISTLNGKELMGRPIRLKFSDKHLEASGCEHSGDGVSNGKFISEN